MTTVHVADTGLFVAVGGPDNPKYRALRRVARRNGIEFLLPERVYEELTEPVEGTPPVETAIEAGWVRVADPLSFERPIVSRVVDGVRQQIAAAADRRPDEIEQADAALAGLAAERLTGNASRAIVYTTDVAAGTAAEAVLAREGYGDSISYVDAFRFVEDAHDEWS